MTTVTRDHNAQNQLTDMDTLTGGNEPNYDGNGNEVADEDGYGYTYDAWNRLASFDGAVDQDYSYDALGRRIIEDPSNDSATDLYYSSAGQVLEERLGGTTKAQNVWGLGYVNDLVLRDRDSDTSSDGTLDSSFSSDGKVTSLTVGGNGRAVVVQPDGKIVVAGSNAVGRLNADGSVDSGFGTSGNTTISWGAGLNAIYASALQADGKIIVVGIGAGSDAAIARLNTDGSLDTSFDTDGKVLVDFGGTETARAVAIQSDGKIVVTGSKTGGIFVLRFNTDGSLDNSFDSDGKQTSSLITMTSVNGSAGGGVLVQADGKIIAGGTGGIMRFEADGSVDMSFGAGDPNQGPIAALAATADGKLADAVFSDGHPPLQSRRVELHSVNFFPQPVDDVFQSRFNELSIPRSRP